MARMNRTLPPSTVFFTQPVRQITLMLMVTFLEIGRAHV